MRLNLLSVTSESLFSKIEIADEMICFVGLLGVFLQKHSPQ
jgi:hypothetical protein